MDAGLPGDDRVQVWWRSGHFSARRSDLRKSLRTDGQTDDGRLAIALAHSWNELKICYVPDINSARCDLAPHT